MRKGVLLNLICINKEGLVEDVKVKGSLGCRNHKIVDFRILRAGMRVKSKLTPLHFSRADFDFCRIA